MAVSKVILNGDVLMDVTQDTVSSDTLLSGQTATGADGVRLTGSASVPQPSDAAPSMDGTAAAGSSANYARADHVHPSDTAKLGGVTLSTSADTYAVPVTGGTANIDVGDGLNVSDSNNRITLKAKTGTTSGTVAAGDHTHSGYQATLVSGTNIKTVNGTSLLGSGNISTAELPSVSASDNGKVLRVISGAWAAASLPSASGVSF